VLEMLRTQQTKINQVATRRAAWTVQLSLCTLARVWWFSYTCKLVPGGTSSMTQWTKKHKATCITEEATTDNP
jgi:uncharacterized membrane protein YhdT